MEELAESASASSQCSETDTESATDNSETDKSETNSNKSVGIGYAHNRRSSISYYRMHDPRLRLTVLKLDNTTFEIKIAMTATVSELKTVVENVFKNHKRKDGAPISWSHVWGSFCLCYNYYKLLDDRAYLKSYGIKDGDQIRFLRHASVKPPSPTKKPQENPESVVQQKVMRLTKPEISPDREDGDSNSESDSKSPSRSPDELLIHRKSENKADTESTSVAEEDLKLSRNMQRWLSLPHSGSSRKSKLEEVMAPFSRSGKSF